MTWMLGRMALATMHAPAAPLPPPTGTTMASMLGWSSRIQGLGGHSGDESRLVAGVQIARPALGCELLGVFPGLVEVRPVGHDLGAHPEDGVPWPGWLLRARRSSPLPQV